LTRISAALKVNAFMFGPSKMDILTVKISATHVILGGGGSAPVVVVGTAL
jgi:hypothetical protein